MAQRTQSISKPQARPRRRAGRPFFGLIDSVIVEDPADFEFDGAISRAHAEAAWTWMVRDLAPDLIDPDAPQDDPLTLKALDALMPDLLARAKPVVTAAGASREASHRLMIQLGGEDEARRLPVILDALKVRALLDKAQTFGRAVNGMADEASLATALQPMPWNEPAVVALLMQAAVGQVANPSRLMMAVIRLAGGATELTLERSGYAPVVEAMLAHAQNQIPLLYQIGPFADIDLTCRAVDRFHRLIRAINGYVDVSRNGRWAMIVAALVKGVSARIEPRLRDVVMDVNLAMRRHREGVDRLDGDQILSALNGVYLLSTVRESLDSLALNALFNRIWAQVGQAIEIHLDRNLDMLRADPTDRIIAERLDAAIKMAELRFNADYADVLRRAKETALR